MYYEHAAKLAAFPQPKLRRRRTKWHELCAHVWPLVHTPQTYSHTRTHTITNNSVSQPVQKAYTHRHKSTHTYRRTEIASESAATAASVGGAEFQRQRRDFLAIIFQFEHSASR